jgi:hypothetical protein
MDGRIIPEQNVFNSIEGFGELAHERGAVLSIYGAIYQIAGFWHRSRWAMRYIRPQYTSAHGLSLMLAHETGHHLGGPPLDPDLRWATWQGQADYWAAREGMPRVFGRSARRLTLRGAQEIAALHMEFKIDGDEPDMSSDERSTIFRAGALGEGPPSCLNEAFNRLFKKNSTSEH